MSDTVRVERQNEIAVVTLNRPDTLNAVNHEMRMALIETLRGLNADASVRALVITGAGPRAFCAGQDLAESMQYQGEEVTRWLENQHAMYQSVRDLDKACVAAFNGVATGAGYQIGLCSDLRITHPDARIGQPEIKAGLASIVGSYLMTLHLGLSHNIELSITGDLISGQRAYELGLVNQLVAREQVLSRSVEMAQSLSQLGPTAMRLTKRRFRELTQPGFDAALTAAKLYQKEAYASGEPQAAMKRFFEARKK
ncbi:MAG: enoyl-CoA hydratase/isomerase family protein [Betaproteobacteria bacterium]|nr:enoyl-CoA hydratase/isomerase family protein [Betaproteobacteria bacterium]